MMTSTIWHHFKPHLFAILGLIFVVVIAFHPMFLKGLTIAQHDVQQGMGATHQLLEFEKKTGEPALWMFTMFSGMPAYLNSVSFSGNFLDDIQQLLHIGLPRPPQIIFLTCLSFYIMLLAFRVRPWVAFIGAVIFGMNGFSIIGVIAGHNAKIQAVSYMPLVIAGIKLAFDKKYLLGTALFALALGLHIQANHLQMTYYLLIITLLFGLSQVIAAFQNKELPGFAKSVGFLLIGAALAAGANFGKLWTVVEYSKYSTRGERELTQNSENESGLDRSYAFQYSNGIYEPLVMFFPNVLGGSSQNSLDRDSNVGEALRQAGYTGGQLDQQLKSIPTYWGDQPLTAPYYLGSAVLFLLVLGFLFASKQEKQWLIPLIVLGVVLSWGSNFSALNNFLFDYLPGYNKFRSVTFTIVIAMLAITLIGAIGLERFLAYEGKDRVKKLWKVLATTGGFAVFMLIASAFIDYKGAIDQRINADWFVQALRADRASLFRQDVWRVLIYSLILTGGLWAWINNKLNKTTLLAGLVVLFLADVLSLSRRFLDDDTFIRPSAKNTVKPTAADQYISAQAQPGERVLNLQNPFNEAQTSYSNESIGGYHGAKMRRYQDLIEHHLSNELSSAIDQLQNNQRNFAELNAINMLNTKFFKAGDAQNAVLQNDYALGQAWLVSNVKKVSTPDEEIAGVGEIDPATTAVINTNHFEAGDRYVGSGDIKLISKTPNTLTYQANVRGGQALGIFSEVFYPEGWKATVNGEEVSILRANYILRALELPEGQYEVVFSFEPNSYYVGAKITWIFSIVLILVFLGVMGLEIRKMATVKEVSE